MCRAEGGAALAKRRRVPGRDGSGRRNRQGSSGWHGPKGGWWLGGYVREQEEAIQEEGGAEAGGLGLSMGPREG